ncbi:MAG: precorrin-2 C(20)-methyltransferase [Desulfobacterales bacterium]
MKEAFGTLYGIGVGPGDPDLITVKAVEALKKVDVIYTASSTKNQHSLAVQIAMPHIPENTSLERLAFPMSRDRKILEAAWQANAQTVVSQLTKGKDAAFLTLGDCLTYSTYGYLARHVEQLLPEAKMVAVPGITSYQAAASRLNRPLVEGEESLLVMSGVKGGGKFRKLAENLESVVFLKAYKNITDITEALSENGWKKGSIGVVSCGLPEERIIKDINDFKTARPDYWTLVLAKQGKGYE